LPHTVQGKDTRTGRLWELAEMEHAKATERQSIDEGGGNETTAKGKEPKATKRQEARRAPPGSCKLRPVKRCKVVFQDDSDEEDWDHLPRADSLWKETAVHLPVREEAAPEEVLGEPILHSPRPSLQSSPTSQTQVRQSLPSPSSGHTTSPTLPL
jgi:phage protein D